MQEHKNHYQILGVDKKATVEEIKKEYKKLALKHHPDKNPDDKQGAKKRFTKIAEAYSVLSDQNQRAAYDRELERPPFEPFQAHQRQKQPRQQQNFQQFQGFQMPQGGPPPNFENIFRQFRNFVPNYQQRQQPSQFQQQPRFRFQEQKNPENMNFGMFDHNIRAPKLNRLNSFGGVFGSRFTFQMAEEIFNSAFQEPKEIKGSQSSLHRANSTREEYHPPKEYVPKNSTLLSQKKIQKNGKQVLVKKYSISDRDGGSHTETIQTVLGRANSLQQPPTFTSHAPTPPSNLHRHQQTNLTPDYFNQNLFKKKSSYQKPEERTTHQPQTMRKGGISTLQRLSSMNSNDRK